MIRSFFLQAFFRMVSHKNAFMNRFKLGTLALISILGIGGAFTTTHKASGLLTNYYSTSNLHGGWTWVTINSLPSGSICVITSLPTLCTVTTSSRPADNTIPQDLRLITQLVNLRRFLEGPEIVSLLLSRFQALYDFIYFSNHFLTAIPSGIDRIVTNPSFLINQY